MVHITVAGLLLAAFAAPRPASAGTTSYNVDPNIIDIPTRLTWCDEQMESCTSLCGVGQDKTNGCDHNSLRYSCQCANGTTPPLGDYTGTIPTFMCTRSYEICFNGAPNEAARQKCWDDIMSKCGTLDPSKAAIEEPSSSISAPGATSASAAESATGQVTLSIPSTLTSVVASDAAAIEPNVTLGPTIAGAVVGGLVFVIAIAVLFYWLGSRRRRRTHEEDQQYQRRYPHQPSATGPSDGSLASKGDVEVLTPKVIKSKQGSSFDNERSHRDSDQSTADAHKTLVTEKANGHEMVQDLTGSSALDDEMYFDTAKYRMPPNMKPV